MKLMTLLVALGALLAAGTSARAEDTGKKVENGAKQVGKTVTHGTTSIGKGASKIFHESAKGVHKVIAHNAGNKETKAAHLKKAAAHNRYAHRKAKQSDREMEKAKHAADKVGDKPK